MYRAVEGAMKFLGVLVWVALALLTVPFCLFVVGVLME